MNAEEFAKSKYWDGNMYPYETDAQEGLNLLVDGLLGEDWYIADPLPNGQVNTYIVYEILKKYEKKPIWEKLKEIFYGT